MICFIISKKCDANNVGRPINNIVKVHFVYTDGFDKRAKCTWAKQTLMIYI